ncbi:hypothetical protein PSACC_01471 [Paramicrosporidium saccamoebae]|uniref:18S rRNA factor 2 n=1 Tax=Paramicrosporidium saccamoebae TaxID=1246581 RepID=A0A2H9TLW9_9FUNG|nr:hypothetical protein PSACC_01471 [Paramicrosporidium saccamoebae]
MSHLDRNRIPDRTPGRVFDRVVPDAHWLKLMTTLTESTSTGSVKTPGIVYLSRIPPSMTPHELRSYLVPFGKLGRVYLAPDEKTVKTGKHVSKDVRERRKARFTEGWVEFLRRKDAKTAALALNGSIIGGKKSNRFHDDMWNVKYLKDFLWSNLNEQVIYEKAVRQKKLQTEISQARKVNSQYIKQSERAVEMEKIEETRAAKKAAKEGTEMIVRSKEAIQMEQMNVLRTKFKQRKPVRANEQD